MYLKSIELVGFKSFAKKSRFEFTSPISAIVGPNGSGKSNVAEAFRFVLGEQSLKSMRGRRGGDLIWGGSEQVTRSSHASVRAAFDNRKRLFNIDFDEVVLERAVHRDGVSEYRINGSQVRLRDVAELMATANIGSSGHHIISQGEADHILSVSPRDRKEMIEDALGLRIYHYKLAESKRKLEKTKENIKQVQQLRREIAPHIKFLKRQVDRIEKSRSLQEELKNRYAEYFKREALYIEHEEQQITREEIKPRGELEALELELGQAKETLAKNDAAQEKRSAIIELESKQRQVRAKKDELTRILGRLEGQIATLEERVQEEDKEAGDTPMLSIARSDLEQLAHDVEEQVQAGEDVRDTAGLKTLLKKVATLVRSFTSLKSEDGARKREVSHKQQRELEKLRGEKIACEAKVSDEKKREDTLAREYEVLKRDIDAAKDKGREAERAVFSIMTKQNELRAVLSSLDYRREDLDRVRRAFEGELKEGSALVGSSVLQYKDHKIKEGKDRTTEAGRTLLEDREEQKSRLKAIERIKIRLEEFGGGSGEETVKEYTDVKERDEFLEREIADLEKSEDSLRSIASDLEKKLGSQFQEGIVRINTEFQHFFALMFGGGTAALSIVKTPKRSRIPADEMELDQEEKEETEEGIDIEVHLPRKKIRGLEVLSGGERALTSIALLFAMSQVNPPPFLVLDETDAALDEANSRRYGDMIEDLSRHSQLILITHNRETMRRAGILYGVTMGRDSISKLLSVKFDEAVAVTV